MVNLKSKLEKVQRIVTVQRQTMEAEQEWAPSVAQLRKLNAFEQKTWEEAFQRRWLRWPFYLQRGNQIETDAKLHLQWDNKALRNFNEVSNNS